ARDRATVTPESAPFPTYKTRRKRPSVHGDRIGGAAPGVFLLLGAMTHRDPNLVFDFSAIFPSPRATKGVCARPGSSGKSGGDKWRSKCRRHHDLSRIIGSSEPSMER